MKKAFFNLFGRAQQIRPQTARTTVQDMSKAITILRSCKVKLANVLCVLQYIVQNFKHLLSIVDVLCPSLLKYKVITYLLSDLWHMYNWSLPIYMSEPNKYLKGENHQKVKKVRKLQAKKTHKNKKFLRLDFEHC